MFMTENLGNVRFKEFCVVLTVSSFGGNHVGLNSSRCESFMTFFYQKLPLIPGTVP